MSAPVTEAHIARARASGFSTDKGLQMAAQFIANNEAAKAERDQLRAEVAWWKNWHEENEKLEDGIAVKVQATIDGLRAEVERLKRDYDYDHKCLYEVRERCELWKQRAELAEAELATERARLDYLSTRGFEHRHHETGDHLGYEWTISNYSESEDVTLRDVIDAEMREDAK